MDFMKMLEMMKKGQAKTPQMGGKASSIMGADNMTGAEKLTGGLSAAMEGGSLINTNAKDSGGYTDATSSAMDGAMKGAKIGGPPGAVIGGLVGIVKGIQNRRTEHRNNQTMLGNAGRQQAADSYSAFDNIIGRIR